ncbi:MAG TPA: type VI secretion system protein TssA [Methylomirabilota bacterium]|jgi:type VI secretion system protein ImpA
MASPATIDFATLLTPIPGPDPSGAALRYAGTYDAIQDARRADDNLAQGDWKRDTKTADWAGVTTLAIEALQTKTKDIQIAAWLVEALVKRHGFAGLRDGLRLLRQLEEAFWPTLHPLVEDDDMEPRAAPLEWLNEKLPATVRGVPITRLHDGLAYSWIHWEESRIVENLLRQNPEAAQEELKEGKVTSEQFDRAVATTSRAFYETLLADIDESFEAWEQLDRMNDEKFGRQSPSLLGLKKTLEDCRALVDSITRRKRELEPDPETPGAVSTPGQARGESVGGDGVLTDRAAALRQLAAVAAFFRRTEPHSPVSYLVQRAVVWGSMPLEEWLREVIGDDGVLARVRETLGLMNPTGRSE